MLLAAGSFLSQMMLLVGMILLAWILIRRNIKMRQRGRHLKRQFRLQEAQAGKGPCGAPLADAPKEVLRWQASMFDLQRELKAELDTKIAVVQSLLRQVDQRMAQLKTLQLSSPRPQLESHLVSSQFGNVRQMASNGFSAEEIAEKLEIPLADIELSLGSSKSYLHSSDSS